MQMECGLTNLGIGEEAAEIKKEKKMKRKNSDQSKLFRIWVKRTFFEQRFSAKELRMNQRKKNLFIKTLIGVRVKERLEYLTHHGRHLNASWSDWKGMLDFDHSRPLPLFLYHDQLPDPSLLLWN